MEDEPEQGRRRMISRESGKWILDLDMLACVPFVLVWFALF